MLECLYVQLMVIDLDAVKQEDAVHVLVIEVVGALVCFFFFLLIAGPSVHGTRCLCPNDLFFANSFQSGRL